MAINVTESRPASRSGPGPEHGAIVAEDLVKTYPGEVRERSASRIVQRPDGLIADNSAIGNHDGSGCQRALFTHNPHGTAAFPPARSRASRASRPATRSGSW